MAQIKLQIPEKFNGFFDTPARYRVAYGGRGSSKSWTFAQMLITKAMASKIRVLCARELQKSIKDSSHKLLADTIDRMGARSEFEIGEAFIRHKPTGSDFIFKGLKHNADEIKSTEGVNICWVEEAHRISAKSMRLLIPTIRESGSEIWFTFNPEDEDDEVYQRFVINTPPARSVIRRINWDDNPWFTKELEEERQYDLINNPKEYEHTWDGTLRAALEGAYYAEELAQLRERNQICSVPYDPAHEVHTWWDIGVRDHTAIWFAQYIGREVRLIDFFQIDGKGTTFFIKLLKEKGYNYGTHNLPHDGNYVQFTLDGKSIYDQFTEMYVGANFKHHKRTSNVNADIHATRTFLPKCVFDKENCHDGIKSLKNYHKKWNPDKNRFEDKPLHDEWSDAADAFRYLAIGYRDHMGEEVPDTTNPSNYPTFNELMGTSYSEPQRRRI